jgi:hypothetical protein
MERVMTEDVETKIVEILDALQNGAAVIGGKVVKYAPDVADASADAMAWRRIALG